MPEQMPMKWAGFFVLLGIAAVVVKIAGPWGLLGLVALAVLGLLR